MTEQAAHDLLVRLEARYADWICRVRSSFVFGELFPALRLLDRGTPADPGLLAVGYNFVGDLWDFVSAPRAAAAMYRAAARHDPGSKWAWAELGDALCNTGEYRAALRALRRAEGLPGEHERVEWALETAIEGLRDREPPRYRDGTFDDHPQPSWEACELLARGDAKGALALLAGRRHPYLRQLRARAYGALGDAERMIDEWEGLASTEGDVEMEQGDWFYFPDRVWDDPRFWRALYALRHRFLHGWSSMHQYTWKIVPEPKRYRRRSRAYVQRHRRRMALWLRFHVARTRKDVFAARRLAARYPGWRRAQTLVRRLTGGRR